MKGETNISLLIKGAAYHFDVSKYTTCHDVIQIARKNVSSLDDNCNYAVFESAFGAVKSLPGNTKVIKLIRSLGVSKRNFTLEIRKANKTDSKMASISRAKKTLQRLRTLITKSELKSDQKLQTCLHNNFDPTAVNKDRHYMKNITVTEKSFESGKQCLSELLPYVNLPIRTPGDGNESVSFTERTPGVGEESDEVFHCSEDRCFLNNGFISDQFESVHFKDNDEFNECAIYENDDMLLADDKSAFEYESGADSTSELERNVISSSEKNSTPNLNDCVIYDDDDTVNLNDCVIYEYDDISSVDDESAFEDDSDCESLFELERNVLEASEENTTLKLNQIKAVFSKGDLDARISKEDLKNSFMQTFIENEDRDEGMESDSSDLMY